MYTLYSLPSHCLPVTQRFRLHFLLRICKHGYYILFVTFKFLFMELTYLVLLFETGSYCISRTGLKLAQIHPRLPLQLCDEMSGPPQMAEITH